MNSRTIIDDYPYPALARLAAKTHLGGGDLSDSLLASISPERELWQPKKSCFVSIKNKAGDLRGCIGTIFPLQKNLGWEIMTNAVSAATRDPRFKPVRSRELQVLNFSVDVLTTPELISSLDDLDPAIYGVIVEKGDRRGLLLPNLPGVDSVLKQLDIAAKKGGITDIADASIKRFAVARYVEAEA